MSKYRHHVFVCHNRRSAGGRPSCGARGGALLRALNGRLLRDPAALSLCAEVAVTGSGCLGPCFDGPVMVVYPAGVFYQGVQPGDVDEIVTRHLIGGEPVRRLVHEWSGAPGPDEDESEGEDGEGEEDQDEPAADAPGGA